MWYDGSERQVFQPERMLQTSRSSVLERLACSLYKMAFTTYPIRGVSARLN